MLFEFEDNIILYKKVKDLIIIIIDFIENNDYKKKTINTHLRITCAENFKILNIKKTQQHFINIIQFCIKLSLFNFNIF